MEDDRYELRGDCLIDRRTQSLVYDDVTGRAGELLCDKMNELESLESAVRDYLSIYVLVDGEYAYYMGPATARKFQESLKRLAAMVAPPPPTP